MKKYYLIGMLILFSVPFFASGQKIHKGDVPSLIINSFHQHFPLAYDAEWNKEQEIYKVEFETGVRRNDHSVWFDSLGKIIKHKEEISKSKLPEDVLLKLTSEFKDYRVSDVKRIIEKDETVYTLELKKAYEEWKVSFDKSGTLLSKVPD